MLVRMDRCRFGRHMSEAVWSALGIERHLVDWANAEHAIYCNGANEISGFCARLCYDEV